MTRKKVTAWLYELKDYNLALEQKERVGGVLTRERGPLDRNWYVVRPPPLPDEAKEYE